MQSNQRDLLAMILKGGQPRKLTRINCICISCMDVGHVHLCICCTIIDTHACMSTRCICVHDLAHDPSPRDAQELANRATSSVAPSPASCESLHTPAPKGAHLTSGSAFFWLGESWVPKRNVHSRIAIDPGRKFKLLGNTREEHSAGEA